MTLTGKCKEDFESYLEELDRRDIEGVYCDYNGTFYCYNDYHFSCLPESMQYGVIVDFSETVEDVTNHKMVEAEQSYINGGHSRHESRIMTVEKFDKRYNQNK
tara:strand:- start:84 stop:392 length:309 start_codon:yes stop_codon:yes gene_type:complete